MKRIDLEDIVYGGKIQPQNMEFEEAILGAVMLEAPAIFKVIHLLQEETFYFDSHKLIWKTIIALHNERAPIDILTVTNQLRKQGDLELAGGIHYVVSLTNKVASAANIETYARKLVEFFVRRQMITLSGELGKKAFDDTVDAFELQEETSIKLLDLHRQIEGLKGGTKSWGSIVDRTKETIFAAMDSPSHISGIPTGNYILDAMTGGWQKTDLIYMGGRPGMGKTSRAISFLKSATKAGYNAKLYSFEMSAAQLVKRMIAAGTGFDLQDLNRGKLSEWFKEDIERVSEELKRLPIMINDNGRTTIFDMANDCRVLKSKGEIDFLIVDFVQICKVPKSGNMSRNDILTIVSGELKNIAKECDIPVLALAALSRKADSRPDKRPQLEDLRESGSLESDADMIMFQFRPDYYTKGDMSKRSEEFKDMDEGQYRQHSELIIEKHRNGKTGTLVEYFDGATQKFNEHYSKSGYSQPPEDPQEKMPF